MYQRTIHPLYTSRHFTLQLRATTRSHAYELKTVQCWFHNASPSPAFHNYMTISDLPNTNSIHRHKAVNRNLFRAGVSPVPLPFSSLTSLFPLFLPPWSGSSNQLRYLGSAVSSPSSRERYLQHQTRSLGSKYTKKRLRPSSCKCRPIIVKRNLKIEANMAVSECTVCYQVVAY